MEEKQFKPDARERLRKQPANQKWLLIWQDDFFEIGGVHALLGNALDPARPEMKTRVI